MGLYIPGMKMPPKGKRLFVAVNGCGDVYLITSGAEIITKYQPSVKAVELPPHGRLIDADALENEGADVHQDIEYCGYIEDTIYGYSHEMIENAPTIIPADPEGGSDG